MGNNWNDFSDAEEHIDRTGLIPVGTLAKVRLKIKPGGYDDPSNGWTGGLATRSDSSGSVYLSPEFTVIGGHYNKRKIWKALIGLYSPKGPEWGNSGRSFIRAMLESARGINPKDASDKARQARQISSLSDLDGLEFIAKIGVEKGSDGYDDSNAIQTVILPGHKDYAGLMDGTGTFTSVGQAAANVAAQASKAAGKPAWMD
ncbi:hypothetical protein [Neotabrizicola sp. sgz301269]|uniref:hypothetical protein n=1 Tax=Neotabrizicola sp. sgz301269 TaxID=3276282 RepID=UPI00376F54E6